MPKNQQKPIPTFLAQARAFYADAFAHHRKATLSDAMSEWEELDESEQSFTLAHLSYLNIEAQAQTQQLLVQVRDLLNEIAEAFTVAVEASFADEVEQEEEIEVPGEDLPLPELPQSHADVIDAEPPAGSP